MHKKLLSSFTPEKCRPIKVFLQLANRWQMVNKSLVILVNIVCFAFTGLFVNAQKSIAPAYSSPHVYTGIEVGSKGVKISVIEIGKNAKTTGTFRILKDSSVNTDFINFTPPTFQATLNGLTGLYLLALKEYKIPANKIFTVVSSGVKMQAEKDNKNQWVQNLADSFRTRINEPSRKVDVVDVLDEARLSHLGIVPEKRRFTTFLLDIGSGNAKGGFFPGNDTKTFKLFQLNWGTKSTANETEKRLDDDKSLNAYNKQLSRVLYGAEQTDIIYAVNASGAYPLSDNIAISGGIAWAAATLMHPEQLDNTIVVVTYADVVKFNETLLRNHKQLSGDALSRNITSKEDREAVLKEVNRVHQVFDQRSLMAGTGLMLKIMRQFESVYETKQFFLVKNGQVGWISAYVDQSVSK